MDDGQIRTKLPRKIVSNVPACQKTAPLYVL